MPVCLLVKKLSKVNLFLFTIYYYFLVIFTILVTSYIKTTNVNFVIKIQILSKIIYYTKTGNKSF